LIAALMPILNECQQGSKPTSLLWSFYYSHQNRLTEEISHELHALHSAEEAYHSKSSNLESAQYPKIILENDTTSSSAESALFRTDLSEDALSWLNTTSNDVTCFYNLGNLKLEAHIVIELFQ
jgi:hypothetical protein